MDRNVSKVDVQIGDMPDPFPCLFDVPERLCRKFFGNEASCMTTLPFGSAC